VVSLSDPPSSLPLSLDPDNDTMSRYSSSLYSELTSSAVGRRRLDDTEMFEGARLDERVLFDASLDVSSASVVPFWDPRTLSAAPCLGLAASPFTTPRMNWDKVAISSGVRPSSMARKPVAVVAAAGLASDAAAGLADDAGVSELDDEDDVDDESVAAAEVTCID